MLIKLLSLGVHIVGRPRREERIGRSADEFAAALASTFAMAVARQTIAFAVRGPIARTDLPGLCNRICALFEGMRPDVAFCDAADVPADAVTVDALARLQLAARRYGCTVRLRNASPELLELLAFLGLEDVLPE
jgi:ABC-type transporter Mla MlaB component